MRCLMVFLLMLVLSVVLISGSPIDNFEDEDRSLEQHARFKRATCDLFQAESLCALHCLMRGRTGGYCNAKKVCICR